jgi:hypothetical protein
MLREAFGEHSLSWTAVFERHSRSKASWVSFEDDECSGQPSTSKMTENIEKIENSSTKLAYTVMISYGVCQKIETEKLNMRHIAPPSRQHSQPHVPENHRVCD